MALKTSISVKVAGVSVTTFPAMADFTTDVIEWASFDGFALNVWFPVLNGASAKPTISIEVSNTNDLLSFKPLINDLNTELADLDVPRLWASSRLSSKYIRFIYKGTGVTASSTVTFNLNKLIDAV